MSNNTKEKTTLILCDLSPDTNKEGIISENIMRCIYLKNCYLLQKKMFI